MEVVQLPPGAVLARHVETVLGEGVLRASKGPGCVVTEQEKQRLPARRQLSNSPLHNLVCDLGVRLPDGEQGLLAQD